MKNVQKYQLCCSPLMSTLFIVLACHWCLQASTKCKQQKILVGCVYFNSTKISVSENSKKHTFLPGKFFFIGSILYLLFQL